MSAGDEGVGASIGNAMNGAGECCIWTSREWPRLDGPLLIRDMTLDLMRGHSSELWYKNAWLKART